VRVMVVADHRACCLPRLRPPVGHEPWSRSTRLACWLGAGGVMFDPAAAVVRSTVPKRKLVADDRLDDLGLRTLTTTQAPSSSRAPWTWPIKIRPRCGAGP
jgi:hypothetical protein